MLKILPMRTQEEVRIVEKSCIVLENTYIIINRTLKVLLIRAQNEMRNVLLETGGQEILVL